MSTSTSFTGFSSPADALAWLVEMGADEIVLEQPVNRFAESAKAATPAAPAKPAPVFQPAPPSRPVPIIGAIPAVDAAALNSIAEIVQALNFFEAHPLRKGAMNLSFFEGPEQPEILVISDRPRNDEDKSGLVFATKARLLLENMLTAIGLQLENVALLNLLPWRPPGNRAPSDVEIKTVLPFARRALQLVRPRLILAFSALPGQHLAGGDASIQRQRGKWLDVGGVPLLSTLHPDELLRMPNLKRQAWRDLQIFQEKLK